MIRLLTLNLLNYVAPPYAAYEFENILEPEQWQKKQNWLKNTLQQADADIIAMQEVFSGPDLKQLCFDLGYPYFAFTPSALEPESHVYRKPGLAIASKHPLQPCDIDEQCAATFSRAPLLCEVVLPHIGPTHIYSVHLKSKRPLLTPEQEAAPKELECYLGRWASDNLRHQEMAALMADICQRRKQSKLPVVIMGDFNDDLSKNVLPLAFVVPEPNRQDSERLWRLHDAFNLSLSNEDRPPSHYYGGQGNVLDYILLSAEFSPDYDQQIATVEQYQCFDRHLTHANYATDSQASDHAAIVINIQPRG
ncbi:endonuclease/exonuclease/phosphatase family protein [Motilimonas pumila]|uniref:Endonuclease/exonuclease/phosphatase family protein n=1 Tax=Motilimonas pumila TaxID=2303987 RepID=A0A418YDQ5_9GAMM|nr:endonuclease/exonuclease/phosphatase family protein [Motilimonas pumila]RJG42665.1 endonuclease/exonuclease/phosphatase family protein [Motilimonas pumila]